MREFGGSGRTLRGHHSVTAWRPQKRALCFAFQPLFAPFPPVHMHGYGLARTIQFERGAHAPLAEHLGVLAIAIPKSNFRNAKVDRRSGVSAAPTETPLRPCKGRGFGPGSKRGLVLHRAFRPTGEGVGRHTRGRVCSTKATESFHLSVHAAVHRSAQFIPLRRKTFPLPRSFADTLDA